MVPSKFKGTTNTVGMLLAAPNIKQNAASNAPTYMLINLVLEVCL